MKKIAILLFVVAASAGAVERAPVRKPAVPTTPQSVSTCFVPLSAQGKSAFETWHLCTPPEAQQIGIPAGYFAQFGSRRPKASLGQTLKYRIASGSGGQYASHAPAAAAAFNAQQSSGGFGSPLQLVATTAGDSTAFYTFRTGSTMIMQSGQPFQIAGCANNPFFVDPSNPVELDHVDIVCRPGAANANIIKHELLWHLFTFCHTGSNGCGGANGNSAPPPDGNCVAGQTEVAQWLGQCPSGSVPQ